MSKRKRDLSGVGLAALSRFAGSRAGDKLGKPAGKALYRASKVGFQAAAAAGRQFKAVKNLLQPARAQRAEGAGVFDLTPTDEQAMISEAVGRFADERLRPAAQAGEQAQGISDELRAEAVELGLCALAVPEALGGADAGSAVTYALIAEQLGRGDMGQAVALLAPAAVANALSRWGSAAQQDQYLAAFASESPPAAALALHEPVPLPDPSAPRVTARRDGEQLIIDGEKSLVPIARSAELFIVSVSIEDEAPRLLLLEASTPGISIADEPAMGLRAAGLGRLRLADVSVDAAALLGDADTLTECIHLSRLAWCALAVGAGQAVLDYVVPYVNERVAFGEPVSHRQGVAFPVANIGIELNAMRLMTWRAAARADAGKKFFREARLAHGFCAAKAMEIGSAGVQLLGGHGFVCEHPVERWYRDLRAVGTLEGGVLL